MGEIEILTRLTLGKYCTGTEGVVELRNLSRFPASSIGGAGGGATPASAATAAFADGLEGASGRLSASFGGGAVVSAAPEGGGGGFCLAAALGVSATAAGDEGRWPLSRCSCSSCCWRRTWGGL